MWRQGGHFKNVYELLNLGALKILMLYKNHISQCMGKIFCVEFQRVPLKFHTTYLTHTLKEVDFFNSDNLRALRFKSSWVFWNTPYCLLSGNSWGESIISLYWIEQSHKSHSAPVPYPTIHHFGTKMFTYLFQSGALWDKGQMHCGICEIVLLGMLVTWIDGKTKAFSIINYKVRNRHFVRISLKVLPPLRMSVSLCSVHILCLSYCVLHVNRDGDLSWFHIYNQVICNADYPCCSNDEHICLIYV